MSQLITPRRLHGFRDYPPALMIPRERLLEQARRVYRSYGFAPIDTPALEYSEILLGKGGEESDKQLYRFQHDRHDIALRFDLTVPFARFAAMTINELGVPFKRYHLGPVWRGEAPQRGRFREFWQCDFDTIGTTANAADIEVALVINDLLLALGIERFQIRINNRMVLNGLLEELGLAKWSSLLLRALDKLPRIGAAAVIDEMVRKSSAAAAEEARRAAEEAEKSGAPPPTSPPTAVTDEQARRILDLASLTGSDAEILDRLQRDFGGNPRAAEGIARLRELVNVARAMGLGEDRLRLDLSIARGLDYYTGTIYETFLLGTYKDEKGEERSLESFGSVCSGGRYDNLAGLYTKQKLPGVGASLGLDRLLEALKAMDVLPKVSTPAPVLIVQFSPDRLADYLKMAARLRGEGLGVEVFPEPKKIGQQLKYADQRGFRAALIAGDNEFARGEWKVKNLATHEETTVVESGVVAALRGLLAPVGV
jgi:histidyl-tRNA synthetase